MPPYLPIVTPASAKDCSERAMDNVGDERPGSLLMENLLPWVWSTAARFVEYTLDPASVVDIESPEHRGILSRFFFGAMKTVLD